ncbi:hypothetical protein D3C78_1465910 [compost metagenome]
MEVISSVVRTIALTIMMFRDRFVRRLLPEIREIIPLLLFRIMSLPPTHAGMTYNSTILNSNDPIGCLSDLLIMGNHHDRLTEFLTHLLKEDHNLLTCFTIKITGGLIS